MRHELSHLLDPMDTDASQSKGKMKTLYLIRHAESEENVKFRSLDNVIAAFGAFSLPSWKDVVSSFEIVTDIATQVDPLLSETGMGQVEHMGQKLKESNFLKDKRIELVVHSPMNRARMTSKGLLNCMAPALKDDNVESVVEKEILVERTPAEFFPGNFKSFAARIEEFEEWLLSQEAERIAVVGHSLFFREMLKLDFKFGNCDVWSAQLHASPKEDTSEVYEKEDADGTFPAPLSQKESSPAVRKRWQNLEMVAKCDFVRDDIAGR